MAADWLEQDWVGSLLFSESLVQARCGDTLYTRGTIVLKPGCEVALTARAHDCCLTSLIWGLVSHSGGRELFVGGICAHKNDLISGLVRFDATNNLKPGWQLTGALCTCASLYSLKPHQASLVVECQEFGKPARVIKVQVPLKIHLCLLIYLPFSQNKKCIWIKPGIGLK